jgi:hypothetical protein
MDHKNTVKLWEGPSPYNGRTLIASLTYVSMNAKTGPSSQVAILDKEVKPSASFKHGTGEAVASMCGNCHLAGSNCYPNPLVYDRVHAAASLYTTPILPKWQRVRSFRWGSIGDPAFLPLELLDRYNHRTPWTGYTHTWAENSPEYAAYFMASIDPLGERLDGKTRERAKDLGYRTYRILMDGEEPEKGEVLCPYVTHGTQCIDCGLCSGWAGKGSIDIAAPMGGAPNKIANMKNKLLTIGGE